MRGEREGRELAGLRYGREAGKRRGREEGGRVSDLHQGLE
jgi:hypothetical protein